MLKGGDEIPFAKPHLKPYSELNQLFNFSDMYSLNRAQVIGNVTRDPEVRQTAGNQAVASFSVATNRTWTDQSGQKQEKAEFHNIVAWGKLAEIVGQYVKKGRKLFVEGRMQTSSWEGEDGKPRYKTEVVAENIILLDRSGTPTGEGSDAAYERQPSSTPARAPKESQNIPSEAPAEEMSLDDLPF